MRDCIEVGNDVLTAVFYGHMEMDCYITSKDQTEWT